MYALVMLLLQMALAVRKDAFMNSLVIEEAGVILKSKGMVTLTKENLLVSVFKKVQLPQIKSVDCTKTTCKRYGGRIRCSTEPKIVNETESASHWSQEHVRSLTEDYLDRFKIIRDSFTSQLQVESKRPKRWAAFLAAGLSLLTSAFTGVSTYTLSRHISQLDTQFADFKSDINILKEDVVKIHNGVVHMVDDLADQIEHKLSHLNCKLQKDIYEIAAMELTTRWEKELDHLFRYVQQGSVTGPLTPSDLPIEHVKHLIANHKELQPLVFANEPLRLYSLTEAALVNANLTGNTLNIHLVLHIPRITDANTWPIFEVQQVGLAIDKSCYFIEHTDYALLINGSLKQLDVHHCTIHETQTSTCRMEASSNLKPSCLHNLKNCTFNQVRCKQRSVYDASGIMVVGAQVFSLNKQQAMTRVKASDSPKFFSWENTVKIQVDGITFESPSYAPEMYNVNDLRSNINFVEFNETLDVKDFQLTDPKQNDASRGTLSLASIVIAVIAILALIAVTVGLLYWKRSDLWKSVDTEEAASIASITESPKADQKERSSSSTSQYRQ